MADSGGSTTKKSGLVREHPPIFLSHPCLTSCFTPLPPVHPSHLSHHSSPPRFTHPFLFSSPIPDMNSIFRPIPIGKTA